MPHLVAALIFQEPQSNPFKSLSSTIELNHANYDYSSHRLLSKHHIDLRFIKTVDYSYSQSHRDFFPDLSIIDVLMNNKKSEVNNLLHNYELI